MRFVGATPNERVDIVEKNGQQDVQKEENTSESTRRDEIATESTLVTDTTTVMSAMDKVALDLYAISQGTQRLSGEEGVSQNYILVCEFFQRDLVSLFVFSTDFLVRLDKKINEYV